MVSHISPRLLQGRCLLECSDAGWWGYGECQAVTAEQDQCVAVQTCALRILLGSSVAFCGARRIERCCAFTRHDVALGPDGHTGMASEF